MPCDFRTSDKRLLKGMKFKRMRIKTHLGVDAFDFNTLSP